MMTVLTRFLVNTQDAIVISSHCLVTIWKKSCKESYSKCCTLRELTYPTWGSSENHLKKGDMLVPRRVAGGGFNTTAFWWKSSEKLGYPKTVHQQPTQYCLLSGTPEKKSTVERYLEKRYTRNLHPGRLTWKLQITHLERKMIFQTSMIMVHVNPPGCNIDT